MARATTLNTLAAAAAVAAIAAGCGASSPPKTTSSAGGKGPADVAAAAYRYAACMRDHGVSSFPDPQVTVNATQTQIRMMAANPKSPKFGAAAKACRGILPRPQDQTPAQRAAEQQVHRADILSFARCMRGRGIQKFPDPTSQGQLPLPTIVADGVDIHTPAFERAALACIPAAHGILTPAAVRQAVNGTGADAGSGSQSASGSG